MRVVLDSNVVIADAIAAGTRREGGSRSVSATLTVSLPEELKRELDEVAKQEGATPSDIVLRSISKYVLLRRYDAVTARLTAEAKSKGICTEEDVWKRLGTSR